MAPKAIQEGSSQKSEADQLSGCLVRFCWILGGNAVLLVIALLIFLEGPWRLTIKDVLFWAVVIGMIVLRYVDVTRLKGRTMNDEPATTRHALRYAVVVPAASAILWVAAQCFNLFA